MTRLTTKRSFAAAAIASLSLVAACSSGSSDPAPVGLTTANASSSASATPSPSVSPSTNSDLTADLVGTGCVDYLKSVGDGIGSLPDLAQLPVATAVSRVPNLKIFADGLDGRFNMSVNLFDTLNGGKFTVFAPVDKAWDAISKTTRTKLASPAGAQPFENILTYHVLPGKKLPDKLAGTRQTVDGTNLKITGKGDNIRVGSTRAKVICGGIKVSNARLYLIDTVLTPPKG